TKGVNLPRSKSRRRRYLTADEVELLAAEAALPPVARARSELAPAYAAYGLAIYVLAYCGLRWSEFAALRVDAVDLMRGRLSISESVTELNGGRLLWGETKSYEARSVPIPRFLCDELTPHLARRGGRELLFTTVNGEVLRNRNARRSWFDRAVTAIGQPGLTPHELRHTAASLAVSAGANVKAVQRMLGHASAAMTLDIYADLFDSDLDAVAHRLDETHSAARDRVRATGAVVPLR
ncbi:MAG: tyrosine-type recombinase/integrase, partial [Jatrophihabitantaceae bacterium]